MAAGAVPLALAAVACGGGSTLDLADVAVSARDAPADWVPADLGEEELAPTIRGIYGFEFDNRHSVFTDKGVTVSVCLT